MFLWQQILLNSDKLSIIFISKNTHIGATQDTTRENTRRELGESGWL